MTKKPTLLLVEDDEQVRKLVRSMLASENLEILEAGTGLEGLRLVESLTEPLDLLLTDMLLPELSGYDLALELRRRFPRMRVIMMTGYIEGEIVQRGIAELNAAFLDKPFQAADLRRALSDALAAARAAG